MKVLYLRGFLYPKYKLYKHHSIIYRALLSAILLFVSCLSLAQEVTVQNVPPVAKASSVDNKTEITPLKIGDKIPDELWEIPMQVVNHPEGKETITLNDYRGKLIILDFWATWCGSCISAMPKINEEQLKFQKEMVVLPVTNDARKVADNFFKTNAKVKDLGLFSIIEVPDLHTLFPYVTVPYYAWIGPEGNFIASMSSADVTEENINLAIGGNDPEYELKTYINTDDPLLIEMDKLPQSASVHSYAIFIKGRMPSLPSGQRIRKVDDRVIGRTIFNRPISTMYYVIANEIIGKEFTGKRIVYEVDTALYLEINHKSFAKGDIKPDEYNTYDFRIPIEYADSLYFYMMKDLNRLSGYQGRIENRNMSCLALVLKDDVNKLKTKGAKPKVIKKDDSYTIINYPIKQLVMRLDSEKATDGRLVVDETSLIGNIDISLKRSNDLVGWRQELNQHGFDLIEVEREIEVLVLSRNENQPNPNY